MSGSGEIPRFQLLRIKMLREEIKFLEQTESWGASLFLGGIALIARQIIEWDAPSKDSAVESVCLYWPIRLLPALIGLVAFGFLRTVNFRIRGLRDSLYQLVPLRNDGKKRSSCGSVGWWMAAMPLLFGAIASAYLIRPRPCGNARF
jgi:hypothetical protein